MAFSPKNVKERTQKTEENLTKTDYRVNDSQNLFFLSSREPIYKAHFKVKLHKNIKNVTKYFSTRIILKDFLSIKRLYLKNIEI